MNSFDLFLIAGIIVVLIRCVVLVRENNNMKKLRDYWHEVDEENERLRKRLGEK